MFEVPPSTVDYHVTSSLKKHNKKTFAVLLTRNDMIDSQFAKHKLAAALLNLKPSTLLLYPMDDG